MNAIPFSISFARPSRKTMTLVCFLVLAAGLLAANPSYAITGELDGSASAGALQTTVNTLFGLSTGIKALIGFIGFVVAFISLAALRNMGPVLFYVGMAVFGAVGLGVAATIMGAVV